MNHVMTRIACAVSLCLFAASAGPAAAGTNTPWKTSSTLGLTLNSGNSENLTTHADIATETKGGRNEFRVGAEGNYGQTKVVVNDRKETDTSIQNARAFMQYHRLLTERNYAYANAELVHDHIADLRYRLTIGPGLGRYLVRNDRTELSAESGLAYIRDEVGDVTDDRLALRVAEKFEQKLSATAKVWESVECLPAIEKFSDYLLNAEVGAEAAMTTRVSMKIVAQDKYNSNAAPDRDKNDLTVIAGVSITL